jgi:predicted DsbA family dithiol-disulfide isomerase
MIADVAPAPLQESPVSSISKMRVEVFLDLICPRSYITVSRLCDALERFEHRFEVEVVWRGFQLDPTDGRSFEELLADNVSVNWQMEYVDAIDVAREAHARIAQAAIQDGLRYDSLAAGPVDTFAAHRMLHLAAGYGLTDLAVRRIQRAYTCRPHRRHRRRPR